MGERPPESLPAAGSALGTYLSLDVKKTDDRAGFTGPAARLVSFSLSAKNLPSSCLLTPRAKGKNLRRRTCPFKKKTKNKNSSTDVTFATAFAQGCHTSGFEVPETPRLLALSGHELPPDDVLCGVVPTGHPPRSALHSGLTDGSQTGHGGLETCWQVCRKIKPRPSCCCPSQSSD